MKLTTLLPLATLWSAAAAETEYFFRFTQSGKWPAINNQRLRSNGSDVPGVTAAPYNPEDHFNRVAWVNPQDPYTPLQVVPTNPHPPPVPGYYGLSDRDGVPDALRLIYTYRPEEQGRFFYYQEFHVSRVPGKCQPNSGKLVVRYRPTTGWQWRWFVVKEKTPAGLDKCKCDCTLLTRHLGRLWVVFQGNNDLKRLNLRQLSNRCCLPTYLAYL
jgi:hypothetical protein